MREASPDKNDVAARLAMAVNRLKARRRAESGVESTGLTATQLSIMHRLRLNGPATAASLAVVEHVSQQAIAQAIAPLKTAGIVQLNPDPNDGRKALISMTDAGYGLRDSIIASGNAWLVRAIESTINPEELAVLDKTIELLERLADADC